MRKSICGPLTARRAALRDLIDLAQDHKLPSVRHGESRLLLARDLLIFGEPKGIAIPTFSLRQIRYFHAHVTDSPEWHDLALRFVADRIAANAKFHCVAVGIEHKE